MSNKLISAIRRKDILLFILSVCLFTLHPQLDIAFSQLFYDPVNEVFFLKDHPFIQATYYLFARPHLIILPLLIFMAIYCYKKYRQDRHKRYIYSFLLASLLLGPGLIVNEVIKNNSIGRARPVQVNEFGGQGQFTPAFFYSGQCQTNCSFVSGHAAVGFYFIGLGFLLRRRDAFYWGLAIGILISFTRIAKGGHFLSDTVFAFWTVYFTNLFLAQLFGFKCPMLAPEARRSVAPAATA
ncbi:phosphatase PAP2 family protein [Gayadomonas joobiniege]|uniref:phosphatase PAP2 family protein n=1 Tax=Gayadomonas joobiniege TaxID=1234606 RepID=UPI00037A4868|nr:phosphatase PAP2 family protein [Gayadomonas joobiniege]